MSAGMAASCYAAGVGSQGLAGLGGELLRGRYGQLYMRLAPRARPGGTRTAAVEAVKQGTVLMWRQGAWLARSCCAKCMECVRSLAALIHVARSHNGPLACEYQRHGFEEGDSCLPVGAWRRSNCASQCKTTTDYIPNEFPRAPGRREYCKMNGAVPYSKEVAKVACSEPKAIASTAGTDWELFYKANQPWHATSASTRDGVQ